MIALLEFQRGIAAELSRPTQGALRVYRNTVICGAVEALRANHPVTCRLLGDEMFETVAADYAHDCPPRSPVLALYGGRFSDWIDEQAWAVDLPYLADVARLERLYLEALFAADAEALELTDLDSGSDWDCLRLRLHPATRLLWVRTPAMSIWLAHCDATGLDVEWHAEGGLFTRPRLTVQPVAIDRAAHRFLFGVRLGETIGAAATATARLYPDADLGALFTTLVNAGAFAAASSGKVST